MSTLTETAPTFDSEGLTEGEKLEVVPFTNIKIDERNNCRGTILLSDLTELADDIKQNGQLQSVLLRYRHDDENFPEEYVLVAGFSRSISIRDILKGTHVKAVIRHLTKMQCIAINAAENLKRRDLNIMQEAESISRLVRGGMSRDQICKTLGKTTGWVQPRIYLLSLDPAIQDMAASGYLTMDNIRDLYTLKDPGERILAAKKIKISKQNNANKKVTVHHESKEVRKSKAKIARLRTKADIENLQDYLAEIEFPVGIHLRFLAWAAGNISDAQLLADLQTFFMEMGRSDYFPPAEGVPNMKEQERILS